ncbi:hypothetical protein DL93DRAFT_1142043 [Clavulina sp. PMI_390]|nr:hypothetical protein DL93DRAFT_1142043 [Clavulina sp. PMI_390]
MTTTTPIPPFPIQHSNSSNTITSFNGPEVNRTRVPNPFTGVFVDRETFQVSDPSDGEDDEEDEDDLYHVDSAIFENVSIFPRSRSVTPEAQTQPLRLPVRKETPPFTAAQQIQVPPAIRISLATLGSSMDLAGRASAETTTSIGSDARADSITGPTGSRAVFPQPAYPEVRSNRGMPPPLVGSTSSSSSTKRQASLPVAVARPSDIESGALPQKKHNITRTIFFMGFVFPLLWLVGACLIWRHTDYAHSNLSAPPPPAPASRSGSNSSNEKMGFQHCLCRLQRHSTRTLR